MIRSALILAAHGGWAEQPADQPAGECAERLSRLGLFDEVGVAYHQGKPSFAAALEAVDADEVTVVPFMTSEGYYSEVVLPGVLAGDRTSGSRRVSQTRPVGTHRLMIALVARRVRRLMATYRLKPSDTTLALVGHGAKNYPSSRRSTVDLAAALVRLGVCAEVLPVFLDEPPGVETLRAGASHLAMVVEPFLIGGGWHVRRDIPAALGLEPSETAAGPLAGWVGRRFVVCDTAVGTDPEIGSIVIELAGTSRNRASWTNHV